MKSIALLLPLLLTLQATALAQTVNTGPLIAPPPPQKSPLYREEPWLPEYPAPARAERREGTSYVRLAAAADGSVKDCVVTRSSGHQDLDAAACLVAMRRARIPTAHDEKKLRYYIQPIEWKLERPAGPPPMAPPNWKGPDAASAPHAQAS
ncbi:energy transducer TonB [Brevundimonas diminuta]|uniref:energy transducer TonB n=1 Tax=Brevundimonas diminuta TaxID=293 RepID=UPI003D353105